MELPASAAKVQDALEQAGLDCRVVVMNDSTRTVVEASQACGCQVGQIVKSLLFQGKKSGQPYMFLVSGCNMLDSKKAAKQAGEKLSKADPEIVREKTGYAIGGVPPLGHAEQLSVWVDEDLMQHEEIWAAAGTPHAVFEVGPNDLVKASGGIICDIKK